MKTDQRAASVVKILEDTQKLPWPVRRYDRSLQSMNIQIMTPEAHIKDSKANHEKKKNQKHGFMEEQ